MSDEARWKDLMVRSQAGDKSAYRQLLGELYPVISGYLKKRLGALGHEEDFVQECLMAVHSARHTYDAKRPFSPWMFTVVRYKSIDLLRKKQRIWKNEVVNDEIVTAAADETNDLVDGEKDMLQEALAALPEAMRRAVELTKIQGLDSEEAAKQENISSEALRALVSRAYKIMRKHLEKSNAV